VRSDSNASRWPDIHLPVSNRRPDSTSDCQCAPRSLPRIASPVRSSGRTQHHEKTFPITRRHPPGARRPQRAALAAALVPPQRPARPAGRHELSRPSPQAPHASRADSPSGTNLSLQRHAETSPVRRSGRRPRSLAGTSPTRRPGINCYKRDQRREHDDTGSPTRAPPTSRAVPGASPR